MQGRQFAKNGKERPPARPLTDEISTSLPPLVFLDRDWLPHTLILVRQRKG